MKYFTKYLILITYSFQLIFVYSWDGENAKEYLSNYFDPTVMKYSHFPESLRIQALQEAKEMFQFGYDCYMKCAFPMDELDPIRCKGRGPDYDNPSNININDVLGDYSLTLIDSLDSLAIMGNITEFKRALDLVVNTVSFEKFNTVQIFEANIRVLGGLLAAHLLIEDVQKPFGDITPKWYSGELLKMAHDLADRMLSAFETRSGLPHPRINLINGVPVDGTHETCTAGAGSLVLEMGLLSRLLNDPIYENYARRAVNSLWSNRDNKTGLFGYVINVTTEAWLSQFSGLGAGMDSFYEYLLKSQIVFDNHLDGIRFKDVYSRIVNLMRRGRKQCNKGGGSHPFYVNVDMSNGNTANYWIDSLQSAFPGVQVLYGDLEEAICHHAYYYAIWKSYGCLPERFNWKLKTPEVRFYPLRPEFIESTYFLYQATKHPFYLHVGHEILSDLQNITRTNCGYATVHDVYDKSLEDRQESFFLSETCKYLYLLFDIDNPINKLSERYMFTTEGHIIPLKSRKTSQTNNNNEEVDFQPEKCDNPGNLVSFNLPIRSQYFSQLFNQFGLDI